MNKATILDEALKKGYVLLHITKVVVSGSAGNGKTHAKYVLFNELGKLSLIRKSTPLFDDPIRALSRELVGTDETGCEWFRVTYDELNEMLAQSIEEGVDMEELPQPSGFDEETQVSDTSIKAPEKVPQETTHSETKLYEKEKPMKQVNAEDTLIKSSSPNISQCNDPNVISESGANVSVQVQPHHSHQNPTNESDMKVLNVDKEVPSKSSDIATDSALFAGPSPVQLAVPQETTHSQTKVYEKEKPMKQVNTEDTLINSSAPNISQCSDPNVISESGANVSLQVQSHHSHQNPTNESDTKVLNVDKEVPSKSSDIAMDSALVAGLSPVQLATEDPRSVTKTTASVIEITDDTLEHSQTNVPSKEALPITVDLKSSSSVSRLELLQIMESKTKSKPLHLHWIQFIDSGGQPQFHELLQAFIRNTSVVMIVLKLSESLDFFPEIAYYDRQTGQLCGNTYTSSLRNDQIIQRCIRTLSKDKQSRVLVVGTHLDLAHKSTESIEDKNKKLLEMLTLALGKKLITRSPDKVVFPLNALTPGEDDQKVAGEIRGEIAKDKHLSEPYKVPIAWFLLEQDMQKLERSVVNLHTCYQLGSILHMTKTTVNAALDYFHELNIILYYPSILPNVVFVSPQVIVDKVTELIECSFYLRGRPESEEMDSDERWQTFIDHGELSVETLADPKFTKHFVPVLFTPHQLLLVFQNLFIVAPISDTTYFMPSLLPEIVSEELEEYRPTTDIVSPVLVYFPDGCCPGGAFCCLCVYLISKCGWKTEGKLFRNYLLFHVGCENHEVVIIDAFHYFEVYLKAPSYVAFEFSSTILHHIKSGLKEAATSLHQEEIRYHFAVLCPSNKESTCDSSPHAAVVSNTGQYWTCTKDPKFTGELDKQQATWFSHSQQLETLKKKNQELLLSQMEKDNQIQRLNKQLEEMQKQLKQQQEDKEEISTLALPGAQLISKGKLTIERIDDLQTLEWKNHGLKVHVPPGTLPDSEDTCDIVVATSFSGSFILPKDHTLVSAIYYIQPSMKLTKPVTLEIEHCCSIETENDTKSIVPIFAQSSSRKPPYVFQPLNGGVFTPGSFWGSFNVSTFSTFGIGKRKNRRGDHVQHSKLCYSGRLYYRSNNSNGWFFLRLVVMPKLTKFQQVCLLFIIQHYIITYV